VNAATQLDSLFPPGLPAPPDQLDPPAPGDPPDSPDPFTSRIDGPSTGYGGISCAIRSAPTALTRSWRSSSNVYVALRSHAIIFPQTITSAPVHGSGSKRRSVNSGGSAAP